MTRLISSITTKVGAASIVVLAAMIGLFLVVLMNDDGEPAGLSSQPQAAGAGNDEPAKALCLAPGVSAGRQAELVAQLRTAGESDRYEDTVTGPVELSPEEARDIVDFQPRLPETPAGWNSTVQLRTDNPRSPLESCYLEVQLTDPSTSETLVLPEQRGVSIDGEPFVLPEQRIEINKGATLVVRQAAGPLGGSGPSPEGPQEPGVGPVAPEVPTQSVEVQGQPAQLMTRDYDEPSVAVGWQDGGVTYGMQCSLMTVDECLALAETLK